MQAELRIVERELSDALEAAASAGTALDEIRKKYTAQFVDLFEHGSKDVQLEQFVDMLLPIKTAFLKWSAAEADARFIRGSLNALKRRRGLL